MSIEVKTSCNRDCPDACGIVATVVDGQVCRLRGDPDHPITRGFLCFRTSRYVERQSAEDRLTTAWIRRGGRHEPIALSDALDLAAERLLAIRAESGPASIFHYRSGGSLGLLKHATDHFFAEFGPCATKVGDICSGAGEAAQMLDFGVSDSNDLFDLHNSRHIVLWGKNPKVSNVHLVPVLQEARDRGAEILLIDPVHQKSASLADEVLVPRPGADLELALGVARALLNTGAIAADVEHFCDGWPEYQALLECRTVAEWATLAGVDEAAVHRVAERFASGPTAIQVGWGLQRRARGGATVRALDALSAVSDNLFAPGGGCSFYFARRGFAAPAFRDGSDAPRTIREPLLGQDILAASDPPIRAIWVTAGNPVVGLPDSAAVAEAFDQTEFVVVADTHWTDTARRADLVLPVPTFLEDDDLIGSYGHHFVSEARPVVPPPPGVLHELVLFQELARRVGLGDALAGSIDDWKRRLLEKVSPHGLTLERLRSEGAARNPLAGQQRFTDRRVATPSGRVQLLGGDDYVEPTADASEYPLWLFSNSTEKSQSSQWAGRGLGKHTWVVVHPEVIAAAGASVGDIVSVESEHGVLQAELRGDSALRGDVAVMPKGGGFDRGHCANQLIAARATDLGLGASYLDCRVRLRASQPGSSKG